MSDKLTSVSHLREASQRSGGLVAELSAGVVEAMMEMDGAKADKSTWHLASLPADGWTDTADADTLAAGFAYSCDLAFDGLTAADSAETLIAPSHSLLAAECCLCPTSDVLDGVIRYYAVQKPAEAIIVQIRPIYGAAAEEGEA